MINMYDIIQIDIPQCLFISMKVTRKFSIYVKGLSCNINIQLNLYILHLPFSMQSSIYNCMQLYTTVCRRTLNGTLIVWYVIDAVMSHVFEHNSICHSRLLISLCIKMNPIKLISVTIFTEYRCYFSFIFMEIVFSGCHSIKRTEELFIERSYKSDREYYVHVHSLVFSIHLDQQFSNTGFNTVQSIIQVQSLCINVQLRTLSIFILAQVQFCT